MENNENSVEPNNQPRKGWEELFREMHENGDDELLISDVFEDKEFDNL